MRNDRGWVIELDRPARSRLGYLLIGVLGIGVVASFVFGLGAGGWGRRGEAADVPGWLFYGVVIGAPIAIGSIYLLQASGWVTLALRRAGRLVLADRVIFIEAPLVFREPCELHPSHVREIYLGPGVETLYRRQYQRLNRNRARAAYMEGLDPLGTPNALLLFFAPIRFPQPRRMWLPGQEDGERAVSSPSPYQIRNDTLTIRLAFRARDPRTAQEAFALWGTTTTWLDSYVTDEVVEEIFGPLIPLDPDASVA